MSEQTIDAVREYYGQVLKSTDDLKTSACCADESPPEHIRALLGNVHDDVQARFYGCGSPLPLALEGCTVLDLGCGSGRDVYLLSQLVGPSGRVIGIDMTDEQLSVAETYKSWHMERFGFAEANVSFLHGYIEELAGIGDASVDVIVPVAPRLTGYTEAIGTVRRRRGEKRMGFTRLADNAVVILRIGAQAGDLNAVDPPGIILHDAPLCFRQRLCPTGQATVHCLRGKPFDRAAFFVGRFPHDRNGRDRRPLQIRALEDGSHGDPAQNGWVQAKAAPAPRHSARA